MAAAQPAQDSVDCMLPLQSEIVLEKNPSKSAHAKEQLLPSKDANMTTSIVQGASSLKLPKGAQEKAGFLGKGGEQPFVYQPNVYSPQPQTLFAGGYRNPSGQWEEYPHYVGVEGLDAASPMMYGAFSPVSTVGDAQPYFPLQYPFANSYYQSPASSSIGYSNSATGVIDPMLQQEYFLPDGLLFSPTPGYHQPFGSFNKAPRQPSGARGFFGQGNVPPASGMHQGSMYGSGSYKVHQQGGKFGGTTPSWSTAGHRLHTFDMGSKQEKGGVSLGGQNGYLEFMNEQNRGPRSTKPKRQDMEHSSADDKNEKASSLVDCELYNHPDFVTEYRDAKFFVIKSYTEDHVHRSIKYRVWASTASGNRKLDCAYSAAKDKEDYCPIFLFFSVNGSGQFCGVAEMIGPVDFDKSVDYWQQDKWSGQFPVKWHIVKDVPNNLLRHIILENNDNKPVTNSRDTQEVKLELGLQMLTIFKNHEPETTVLEDFDFYEQREKAMQENRQRQQQHSSTEAQKRVEAKAAEGLTTQISDTFAQAIRLEDTKNNGNKPKVEGTTAAAGKTEEDAASTNANPVEENN